MTISDLKRLSEQEARELIEGVLWPNGPSCHKCGNCDQERIVKVAANKAKRIREGLYRCKECRATWTVTKGTVMEGTHLPMNVWVFIIASMLVAKKGVSARQLQRELKEMHPNGDYGNYRNMWHACHRVRHAMADEGLAELLGGEGRIVEADESGFAGQPRHINNGAKVIVKPKTVVLTLVERGGRSRSKVIPQVDSVTMRKELLKYVDTRSRLMTDNHKAYVSPGKAFASHETTAHTRKEYARGDVHSNSAEGWFSAAKLSYRAIHHGYSPEHTFRYLAERDFMWSTRNISDVDRVLMAIKQTAGRRLYYKAPKGHRRPTHAECLVVGAPAANGQEAQA
jgi:hypothetical protein